MPKSASKEVIEYELSRYACYLIVQNGDLRKEVTAHGQTYFAIQARRQGVVDYFNQLDEDNKRLVVCGDIKQWNQMLAEAAQCQRIYLRWKKVFPKWSVSKLRN